ncbi:MAG: OadG family protein [Clostridia bacterium]|nr:OadG family protein [Clostridia bacterium]
MIPAIANAAVNNGFVVAMGIGTVFVGLICIILLIKLMSMVTALFTANAPAQSAPAAAPAPVAAAPVSTAIENRAEIIAAVCAAAAEEMGTDISALRVVSFKKIS